MTATVITGSALAASLTIGVSASYAASGWSVVPYIGSSQLSDQSPVISADGIAAGEADVSVSSGFVGGLSFRYDLSESRFGAEIGWEYRSNDSVITSSDGTTLDDGNYASNTFYLNGRYKLMDSSKLTPWLGGGISVIQEIDIDSEGDDGERSFEDSGAVGFQLMGGVDYKLTDRLYLSSELRYTRFTDLELDEENGEGQVRDLDYQPVTLGLGVGFRF